MCALWVVAPHRVICNLLNTITHILYTHSDFLLCANGANTQPTTTTAHDGLFLSRCAIRFRPRRAHDPKTTSARNARRGCDRMAHRSSFHFHSNRGSVLYREQLHGSAYSQTHTPHHQHNRCAPCAQQQPKSAIASSAVAHHRNARALCARHHYHHRIVATRTARRVRASVPRAALPLNSRARASIRSALLRINAQAASDTRSAGAFKSCSVFVECASRNLA